MRRLRSQGWNAIRLGVVWAGAQPREADSRSLDAGFVSRLHALLELTDAHNVSVILDNHGDMVGTLGCGNGVPAWVTQRAAPDLVGKPLRTELPYSLFEPVDKVSGYEACGTNETLWALHAGDPLYNLLNPCCQAMNSPNPGGLGFTSIAQATMDYVLAPGEGRQAFVRFWALLAAEVARHPSAIAAELMNEPTSIRRRWMFQTWRAAADAINAAVPDMLVAITDVGEGAVLPAWVSQIGGAGLDIDRETLDWIKASETAVYTWHWYGEPSDPQQAIDNAQAIGAAWGVPTMLTEFMSPLMWELAAAANISHTYWHYSAFCNTGPAFGNRTMPSETFGACILGWAGGRSAFPPPARLYAGEEAFTARAWM